MDTMIIAFGLGTLIGTLIGFKVYGEILYSHIRKEPEEMLELLQKFKKEKDSKPVEINEELLEENDLVKFFRVEEHNGSYFLYDDCSDEFLSQAKDITLAVDAMMDRFPDYDFKSTLSKEQARQLGLT